MCPTIKVEASAQSNTVHSTSAIDDEKGEREGSNIEVAGEEDGELGVGDAIQ